MSDLKPCPFCGGDAYTEIYIVEAAAGCRECQFKVTREHRPYEYDGLPKVIAAWNRRALPAVQPDLTDPVVVHANMLRGTIAKPTLDQIIHLYGIGTLCRALVPAIVREAAFATPHVNETPKNEHEARNMLTPATKEDVP